jgi:hypothetical protein
MVYPERGSMERNRATAPRTLRERLIRYNAYRKYSFSRQHVDLVCLGLIEQ